MLTEITKLLNDLLEGLSEQEKEKFYSLAHYKEVAPHELILAPGKVCDKMWYLINGAARMFRESNGKDYTLHIFNMPRFFTDYVSVKDQSPATYSFESLTSCAILEFDIVDFYGLLDYSVNFEKVGRKILEIVLYQETSRLDDLIFHDATQRYNNLLARNPTIFQEVPLKYIASYLKISPETLSRIRNS